MTNLKLGSKGEEVKVIQKVLGTTTDGIFGPNTEKLVKEWQTAHGLTADGIVGPKTYAAMTGNTAQETIKKTNSKCIDDCVTYNPLAVHVTKSVNRPIEYLAIHFTGSSNSEPGRANSTKLTFEKRKASADFCVDNATIVQFNPDLNNYYCWAVGDAKYNNKGASLYGKARNKNTISIEICSTCEPATQTCVSTANHDGWKFTDAALDNAVKIAKIIMKKFNIPIDRVVRHYDISGKLCPGIIGWNNEAIYNKEGKKTGEYNDSSKWQEFKSRLA